MEHENTNYFDKFEREVEEQNKNLLDEMSKLNKNSELYKLKLLQYKTNIMNIKINKNIGIALVGQIF